MVIDSAPIGAQGGHAAGRQLLENMYRAQFGQPAPAIAIGPWGKPYFTQGDVHFSISHSKSRVFCVLSRQPVGMDAEPIDRAIRPQLAEKILSPEEKQRLAGLSDPRDALLRLWVLKEAAAKCSGRGLQGYPNHTDFSPYDPRIQCLHGHYVAVITSEKEE